ncbi:MAG: hypothetical protein AB8B87_19535 [Granulosicoccus sp.]
MKAVTTKRFFGCVLVVCASFLSACEGESRPFQESVEVQTLGLTGIQVVPPANSQTDVFINSGQSIQLSLTGTTSTGTSVTLSPSDRTWRSSNSSVFTVNENGLLTGVGSVQGSAEASVSIGGVESSAFSVTVSDATLQSIQLIDGSETLERCLPGAYFTVGLFSDGSQRTLADVQYELNEGASANLTDTLPTSTSINATTPGAITLTANAGEVGPLSLQITVQDTLQSLTISPNPAAVDENDTLDFTATGTYTGNNEADGDGVPAAPAAPGTAENTRTENITANVDWEVSTGTAIASVDNTSANPGRLTGLSAGTATLLARCGSDDREDTVIVTVNEADDEADVLSFNIASGSDTLTLGLSQTQQLKVSRGSEFNLSEAFEDSEVEYTVEKIGNTNLDIDRNAILTGFIRPLVQGASVRITAKVSDDDGDAEGSIIVRIEGP